MASCSPQTGDDVKAYMVKAKFLSCFYYAMTNELNIRFANDKNVTLESMVNLASVMEANRKCL